MRYTWNKDIPNQISLWLSGSGPTVNPAKSPKGLRNRELQDDDSQQGKGQQKSKATVALVSDLPSKIP